MSNLDRGSRGVEWRPFTWQETSGDPVFTVNAKNLKTKQL